MAKVGLDSDSMGPVSPKTKFSKQHKEHIRKFSKKAQAHELRQQMQGSIRGNGVEATITKLPSCIEAMIPNSKVTLEGEDSSSGDSSSRIEP